jgi:hypothetical protein
MRLYTITDDYLDHLRIADGKVPQSAGANYIMAKPYVGIVLQIGPDDFIAPLSSYKIAHENIKNSDSTVFKIHALGDPTDKLGIVALKYMIPVLPHVITEIDVTNHPDVKYRALLTKQQIFIRHHSDDIKDRASELYEKVVQTPKQYFVNKSCNFSALIKQATSYKKA